MTRLVRFATLSSFLFHGVLILAGRYHFSYDAYVHMFFADHYRMDWWSLWDERWYTGFPVTSYPPLIHQLMGGLSHLIGLSAAFGLVLWLTVTLLPLAVYCFARIFVGKASAGYAALGAAFVPSVYLTAHIFGQLPFLAGTVLALFGAASLARYLREGGWHNFTLTLALFSTTMAAHHAVLLFQPFLLLAVVLRVWRSAGTSDSPDSSPPRFLLIHRMGLIILFGIALSLLVILPFWEWGRSQTIQTPIDHASRHDFFRDPMAVLLFFLPVYGPLIFIIPHLVVLALKSKLLGLGLAFLLLFLIGLGGTTPLPRLLFGSGWMWLTYDRFAFWASLLLLPLFGMIVILLRRRRSREIGTKLFATLAITSLVVGLVTLFLPLQPGAVDMEPIVEFLEQDGRSDWRYLTFGFGDQLALLSTLTTATTIDGSYHTARSLPELRTSGIAQIDTAFWFPNGLAALDPILQKSGEHGIRWGFLNVPHYIPVLERNGWARLTTLPGGIEVWENPNAAVPPSVDAQPTRPGASFAWGTLPLFSLITSLSLGSLRVFPRQAEKILQAVHAFLTGLIPIALCFWYYRLIREFSHSRVYFTYDHALLFLADALAILAVLVWGSVRIARPTVTKFTRFKFSSRDVPLLPLTGLLILSMLSILWSTDWRTSLYFAIHLWLVLLLVLSLRDNPGAWRAVMLGLCAALAFQIIAGFTGFTRQSTDFLEPLDMKWPGIIDPSMRGASVVQLADGQRILRAYGTVPHPNILGGFTLLSLLGPASLFMMGKKTNIPALILYSLGMILVIETFSRSAWLGVITFLLFLALKSNFLDRKRLMLLLAASLVTLILTLYPLRALVFTRVSNASVQTEQLSTFGRSWLNRQAIQMILSNPLTGVGTGSFILELAGYAVEGAIIEPVHNIVLLIGAELGIPGVLLLLVLGIAIAWNLFNAQNPLAILAGATIAGLGVICLFDHYFWSLAPGRLMLGLALGLWAGQAVCRDA